MSLIRKYKQKVKRRVLRVRKNIRLDHKNDKMRISIFKSLNHVYAQVIDDNKGITIASFSTDKIKESGNKKDKSFIAGKMLASNLIAKGLNEAIFDRGRYLYHGRIKFFVDGLRDGGLKI